METLSFMETSLAQRVKAFGPEENDTIKQWKKLNTEYNIAAMKYLQMDDHDMVQNASISFQFSKMILSFRRHLSFWTELSSSFLQK